MWINDRDGGKVAIKQLLKGTKKMHAHSPHVSNDMRIIKATQRPYFISSLSQKKQDHGYPETSPTDLQRCLTPWNYGSLQGLSGFSGHELQLI